MITQMMSAFYLAKSFYNFSENTSTKLEFFSYYRGVFFCCGEIKCKQGVKNFDEMPVMLSVNQA